MLSEQLVVQPIKLIGILKKHLSARIAALKLYTHIATNRDMLS